MSVRVRYAPSPTGFQHIGGVRTALFNYFFARKMGGVFFLRIEDTDQSRLEPAAIQDIYDTFEWLGIKIDEGPREGGPFGPYTQSERLSKYKAAAEKLVAEGKAYRCFCSSERLEAMRKAQADIGSPSGYDRNCSHISKAESDQRASSGESHVIRFSIKPEGSTLVDDVLLGMVEWPNKDISPDPVILKADGFPTYHLAHAVDDHEMQTTHVLRGQEWLPSAPLHVQLFHALAYTPPRYCHLSTIMGQDGAKLSKRHGSTAARDFKKAGYLKEAILNYVTLLGWAYDGERNFFSREDFEQFFVLEKLSKSPAIFDYQKLDFYNGHYIREMSDEELALRALPFATEAKLFGGEPSDEQLTLFKSAVGIARERLQKLPDIAQVLNYLFIAPSLTAPETFIPKKQTAESVCDVLEKLIPELPKLSGMNDADADAYLHELAPKFGLGLGQVLMPLRLALTGTSASPPLAPSIRLLGIEESVSRLKSVVAFLKR